jgi:uncharacterized YigZ family protein
VSGRYPIPGRRVQVEEEVKKSRFVTSLCPADSVDEANAFVKEIRGTFPDASHHCYAFLIGTPGSTTTVGMSDDGEPHNSAGRPMLNVLVHCGLGDVAVVVTRYWGGTKLGKGGLVRAYSGGVQLALQSCGTTEKIDWARLDVSFDYSAVTAIKRLLPEYEARLVSEDYGEKALFNLELPDEKIDAFKETLTELTNGNVEFA